MVHGSNASCAQYGCPPSPPPSLPYTGWDVGIVGCAGLLVMVIGLTVRNWLDRRDEGES